MDNSKHLPLTLAGHSERLSWLDFFRGLALLIVMLDHMDWWAPGPFFRYWTPVGLGFSDAAEGFVFLSGFTFGWVYTKRLADRGFLYCQIKSIWRAAQIFAGYLLTIGTILILAWIMKDTPYAIHRPTSLIEREDLKEIIKACCLLRYQPFALSILCLYIVLLPLMPTLLALTRWSAFAAIIPSTGLYLAVQWKPHINLPEENGHWFFNPAAWQFVMMVGLVLGAHIRQSREALNRRLPVLIPALLVLGVGVFVKKAELLNGLGVNPPAIWSRLETPAWYWLLEKTGLGPLRVIHFAALAYLLACLAPREAAFYKRQPFRAIGNCGRVPLRTYCMGTVLAYLCAAVLPYFGSSKLLTFTIGFDLVLVQCLLATLFVRYTSRSEESNSGITVASDMKE